MAELDRFTQAYIECALWSSSAELGRCDNGHDVVSPDDARTCPVCSAHVSGYDLSFQDRGFGVDDLPAETLASMVQDCQRFLASGQALLDSVNEGEIDAEWDVDERAGHDFWLTRNGHGAGFWDGDWPEPAATQLDALANQFGTSTLYLGDDRKVYV